MLVSEENLLEHSHHFTLQLCVIFPAMSQCGASKLLQDIIFHQYRAGDKQPGWFAPISHLKLLSGFAFSRALTRPSYLGVTL
jgi:hypothetical protein